METIRMAVVGSNRLMRDFVRKAVPATDGRFSCVADLPCDKNTAGHCLGIAPDLVLFDMGGHSADELLVLHQLAGPAMGWALLIVTNGAPDHLLDELITRKGCGFFSRESSLEALTHAAFLVALGGTYFDAAMQSMIMKRTVAPAETHLSQRERHVLQLVAEGYSTKEVATILRLSTKTVDKYRTSVMQKLDVHDVVKLTHCAIRMGFVTV